MEPRGIFVSSTLVIQFHPRVLTKVDRAIEVQCFYMEADKTVSTDIEVRFNEFTGFCSVYCSMLTTGGFTLQVPMPICRYEIHKETPDGPLLQVLYAHWSSASFSTRSLASPPSTCGRATPSRQTPSARVFTRARSKMDRASAYRLSTSRGQ